MIPKIKQVMKCYRVIAQIERMKTGRPGVDLKIDLTTYGLTVKPYV
jgi:hypothetical protein